MGARRPCDLVWGYAPNPVYIDVCGQSYQNVLIYDCRGRQAVREDCGALQGMSSTPRRRRRNWERQQYEILRRPLGQWLAAKQKAFRKSERFSCIQLLHLFDRKHNLFHLFLCLCKLCTFVFNLLCRCLCKESGVVQLT